MIAQERQIYASQAEASRRGRYEDRRGQAEKFYQEACLIEQGYVRDPQPDCQRSVGESVDQIGEKIEVRRFVRFQLGEGIDGKAATTAAT